MRIAVFQGPFESAGVAANLERLDRLAREGRGDGAPACSSAPRCSSPAMPSAPRRCAAWPSPSTGRRPPGPPGSPATPGSRCSTATPSCGEDGRVYNAALLLDRDGRRLANHRKTHLFGALDRDAFAAGARPADRGRARRAQARHPDLLRRRVSRRTSGCWRSQGVELVAGAHRQHGALLASSSTPLVPTRAYENHLFVAYANRCGREGELEYVGRSCVVGPDGARPRPRRRRRGADPGRCRPRPAAGPRRRSTPTSPTAGPELYGGLAAPGTRP